MAASTLLRGSTVLGIVFLVVAVGLVVLAIVLHRLPANELRVSTDLIELTRPFAGQSDHCHTTTPAGRPM